MTKENVVLGREEQKRAVAEDGDFVWSMGHSAKVPSHGPGLSPTAGETDITRPTCTLRARAGRARTTVGRHRPAPDGAVSSEPEDTAEIDGHRPPPCPLRSRPVRVIVFPSPEGDVLCVIPSPKGMPEIKKTKKTVRKGKCRPHRERRHLVGLPSHPFSRVPFSPWPKG